MPTRRVLNTWSWTSPHGTRELRLYADRVVIDDSASRPSRKTFTLVEAFAQPHMLFIRVLEDYFAVVRAVAGLLDTDALPDPVARQRLTLWRAYDPARLVAAAYTYVEHWTSTTGRTVEAALGPHGMTVPPARSYDTAQLYLPDDVFFYGPPVIGMTLDARDDLRDRLLAALAPGTSLTPADAFPIVDYDAVPERRWTFNQASDGAEDAMLRGAIVFRGYQFGHDMGYSHYPVERVWTRAPGIWLSMPDALEDELRAALGQAIV